MTGRAAVVAAVTGVALVLSGGAAAGTVGVVVDSTNVTLASAAGGGHTADVTLANLTTARVVVAAAIPGDAGCTVTPNPQVIARGRRAIVTLQLTAGCDTAKGADITLSFTPAVAPSYVVKAAPAEAAPAPQWSILGWSLLIGTIVAGLVAVSVGFATHWHVKRPLTGLGTDWSFKDNWVSSATVGSGILVTLLGASNVLQAVLGAEPKAAVALITVAGAVAAALAGISPLLVKLFGKAMKVPTMGGTLLAAFVALIGAMTQVVAVTWQVEELATGWIPDLIIALGIVTAALVAAYAMRSLVVDIRTGETRPRTAAMPLRNSLI